MNIYEALKNGTDAAELTKTFEKELAAAQKKVEEEKTARKKDLEAALEEVREDLATVITEYLVTFSEYYLDEVVDDEEYDKTYDTAYKSLKSLEKDIATQVEMLKKLSSDKEVLDKLFTPLFKSVKFTVNKDKDKDILDKFIKSLG